MEAPVNSILRPALAPLALAALLALPAAPADASPETLKRGLGNILFAPLDLVLSPVVAGQTIYRNLETSEDPLGSKIAYPLPGWIWNTGVQAGASVIRGVTGLMEVPPGLALVFFETDIEPLFDPVERSAAMVDRGGDIFTVKFGIDYTSTPLY